MTYAIPPFENPAVAAAYESFPPREREGLLALRDLIFETAAETPGVGPLEETLKWGQPAYLTPKTRSGSTIRLGLPKQGGFALYTHCQTTLIPDFRSLFPDDFRYEGNRAVHFREGTALPLDPLRLLIRSALTYHLK
ncbi:DUF1801 domain-containing protein [Nisaea nitritireducens]|uniref:DUF1801 domain-containing protein n=1 Tax=Nisaea nitritireducens TaxID=568392 RepID=UPI001866CA43|nr:DUF1801 domain-containing protein [Nisaea nitritireducens]